MEFNKIVKSHLLQREPNIYCGGAFSNPTCPVFGLASAGVWCPHRQLHEEPLSVLESNYALEKQ
eukprot:5643919-Karenia_brevis.AAC.1